MLVDMILEAIVEVFLYSTAWHLLPVLSFGRWTVMPFGEEFLIWQGPAFQRLPDGRIGVGPSMASLFGLLIWIVIGVVAAIVFVRIVG